MAERKDEANHGDGFLPGSPIVGICVGKERNGLSALKWALQKALPPQGSVYFLHVSPPLRWIPQPMGSKLPVEDVNPELVNRLRKDLFLDTKTLVDEYRRICDKNKVASKLCYAENDSVQKELVDQISKLGITKLVLETSAQKGATRAPKKESISAYVARHAPDFCDVIVVCNGKLHYVKDATRSLSLHSSPRSSVLRASDVSTSPSIPNGEMIEDYEKRCEEAVATAQDALRDPHILQARLAEEIRSHQKTVEKQKMYAIEADLAKQQVQAERSRYEEALLELEKVTRKLQEECQLRKEAEKRVFQEALAKRETLVSLGKEQLKYSEYSFQELQSATNNFHEENKLGQGGYGPVYRGKLHHTTVAIKVLAREGFQGREEFQKEVEILSHIHHPHLVMLRGACPEKSCIVYEYMVNGSLEDRLNCRDGTPPLPWYVRFRICLEVATALLFLHSRPRPIVHCNLKPGNILLDHHFVSKISDTGLAKPVPNNLTFSVTMYKESMLVGTFAYIDPDYQRTGVVSGESDVYSLGIVMLQLLTGQQAVGVVDLVEAAVDKGQLVDVLDTSAGEWPLREAMVLACLGLQCAEPRRKNRPNLETKILSELESVQSVASIEAANMACVGPSSSPRKMPIVPGSFFCPISQEIMENPHLAADGFTYEYDSIKMWLEDHNTSPMTNLVLSHNNLIPNHSLRSAIKEWYDNGLI